MAKKEKRRRKASDRTYDKHPRYLDLFAGDGSLSEGFYRVGFRSVAHVEIASSACYTLKTRAAMHWLFRKGKENISRRCGKEW
jgi:DNA (cytosine-5)-methyltransferase 1